MSSTPIPPITPESRANAGDLLKQGRLRQRLTVSDCAKRTHISAHYLESLESGRWNDLPSESHRLGFLRLYSRFLGVPTEEILTLYRKDISQIEAKEASKDKKPVRTETNTPSWFTGSWQQLAGLAIALLVLAWVIYHQVGRFIPEEPPLPMVRERPRATRLVAPNQSVSVQRVRISAQTDSWMRIVSDGQLLYEGILPAGASKQWSKAGTFLIKLGNVQAVSLYWNDQPVDVQTGARGGIKEVQIPLNK